jgi:transcriptional regulator of acetoin/glycerol metabolism
MRLFEQCRWPGNFRQLGNLLRTAAAMVDADGEIRIEHLPDDFFDDIDRSRDRATPASTGVASAPVTSDASNLQSFTAAAISAALARHGGNVSAAARSLGISRNTIYRRVTVGRTPGDDDA